MKAEFNINCPLSLKEYEIGRVIAIMAKRRKKRYRLAALEDL